MKPAGSVNVWRCPKCRKDTMAIHRDPGVTPMMLGCRATEGCDGMAQSLMYPDLDPSQALAEANKTPNT